MLANKTLSALLVIFSVLTASTVSAQALQEAKPRLVMPTTDAAQVSGRKSDSVVNGALVGAAVGFTAGLFVCHAMEPWGTCLRNLDPMLKLGLVGAGIGAGVDF